MLWRRRGERGDKGCSQPRLDIADHVGQRRRVKVLAREVLQVQLPAVHPRRLACPLDALVHKLPDAAQIPFWLPRQNAGEGAAALTTRCRKRRRLAWTR